MSQQVASQEPVQKQQALMLQNKAVKAALRTKVRQRIANVPPKDVNEQCEGLSEFTQLAILKSLTSAARVSNLLLSTSLYRQARRIGVYLSIDGREVGTTGIVHDALNTGKEVFVPYIHKSRGQQAMDMLGLASRADYDSLECDSWGIPTLSSASVADRPNCLGGQGILEEMPRKNEDEGTSSPGLDLLIMPGLAFDRDLNRLGHGKGYYDRYLARYQVLLGNVPHLVALALQEQILPAGEELEINSLDWPVDRIMSGSGEVLRRHQ